MFANEIEKNGTKIQLKKVPIQRRYMTTEGKWESTNSFDVNDLPKLKLVADEAYRHLALSKDGSNGEPGEKGKSE